MRIKFEKGMTPERMADTLIKYIYEHDIVIGAVNMYIQTYDEEMKPEKYCKGNEESYLSCTPTETAKQEYNEYVAAIRRGKFKAVSNK